MVAMVITLTVKVTITMITITFEPITIIVTEGLLITVVLPIS